MFVGFWSNIYSLKKYCFPKLTAAKQLQQSSFSKAASAKQLQQSSFMV
jgi:hypothetical protein